MYFLVCMDANMDMIQYEQTDMENPEIQGYIHDTDIQIIILYLVYTIALDIGASIKQMHS